MFCPKDGAPMRLYRERLHVCDQCGHTANGNPSAAHCLVCGIAMAVSVDGLYYSCPRCSGRDRLRGHPQRRRGRTAARAVVLLTVMLLSIVATAVIAQAATEEYVEVELRPDPAFGDVTTRQDVGVNTADDIQTTIDVWMNDLGEESPNGTYYGTLIQGSAFSHNYYEPYWLPQDIFMRTGRFSYAMVSAHFNFSAEVIMSGASEWWMKVPVLASSIEWSGGVHLAVWQDATDLGMVGFDNRPYYSNPVYIRPSYDGYVPDDMIGYYAPDMDDHYGEPLGEGEGDLHVENGHVYLRVHSVILPETDYIIAVYFRFPNDGELKTLWTTAESPAGRDTRLCFADYKIEDNWDDDHTYYHALTGQELVDVDLDLDWSFIFTEGIGAGLFGVKVPVVDGTIISLFPFFNTTTDVGDDGLIHASFMLPWVSNDTFDISFGVRNLRSEGVFGGYEFEHWQFEPSGSNPPAETFEWFSDSTWDYNDFALFSVNWTLDFDDASHPFTEDDQWNVLVEFEFHEAGNLTLLCFDEVREPVDWADVPVFPSNSTTWPFARPGVYTPGGGGYFLSYGVYCSAWGTYGQWAQRSQTISGLPVLTHYFPSRIYLSDASYRIQRGEQIVDLTPSQRMWNDARDLWASGHFVKAVAVGIKAAIFTVWEGVDQIRGWLTDGLSAVWEGMKSLGHWLYTNLASFFEKIINFFEDIIDIILDIWNVCKYLVAPIILMAVFGGTMKVVSHWTDRKFTEVSQ